MRRLEMPSNLLYVGEHSLSEQYRGRKANPASQVSIVALKDGQIQVVQSSMLGSILSNLLLVMGMCFFFGGLRHRGRSGEGSEQVFSAAVAQSTCSLMTLSSASLVIPAAVSVVFPFLRYNVPLICTTSSMPSLTNPAPMKRLAAYHLRVGKAPQR